MATIAVALATLAVRQAFSNPPQPEEGKPPSASPLPIAQVVLFNSGVGYFQREGQVNGDAHVDLTFQVADINDLLKSLILQDANGGKVGTVGYDSQDPIDKTLRSFSLDLSNNPTLGQLLNQARGEKVEVVRQPSNAESVTLSGTIVGMEVQRYLPKEASAPVAAVDVDALNLLTADGLRCLPLIQVQRVRFLNPTLDDEFRRALEVLARSHDLQKKSVRIHFTGNGKRTVRVGYVVERPIWKTSYRLSLEDKGKLHMQGWALVDNTGDDDWKNVRMVLVTGRPISFRMDLYQPLYVPRPTVEPELFASLRPPVHAGDLGEVEGVPVAAAPGQGQVALNPYQRGFVPGMPFGGQLGTQLGGQGLQLGGLGALGGGLGALGGGLGALGGGLGGFGGGNFGFGGFGGGNFGFGGGGFFGQTGGQAVPPRLTYEQLLERRQKQREILDQAKKAGQLVTGMNFKEGVTSAATGEDIGDSYRYVIDQKVSIPRQKSSMLPIINTGVEGSKVSIYNAAVHAKFPLLGLRLKNTTGHPLMQGPITVYEEGAYAGDTRILDLQPDEERLVSYALDLGSEVASAEKTVPSPEMTFKIGSNHLTAHYKLQQTRTYTIKNRSKLDRTVLIEHPVRSDWKLLARGKTKVERSRDLYRFTVAVPAGKTVSYPVREEQDRADGVSLSMGENLPPRYPVEAGVEVRPVTKVSPQEIVEVKIVKGIAHGRYRDEESKTYFIQNTSDEDRVFTIDHLIRPDWQVVRDGKAEKGPGIHRTVVKVAAGKSAAAAQVKEEHITGFDAHKLGDLSHFRLRWFETSKSVEPRVRAAVGELLKRDADLEAEQRQLASLLKRYKTLNDDQSRMRENLKIVSRESEPYKRFLEKFEKQENQIEELQTSIRRVEASVERQRKDREVWLSTLTVP
jgi:hypothetical protein